MSLRVHLAPEFDQTGHLTGCLVVSVFSAKRYQRGRAYGYTTVQLPMAKDQRHIRRKLTAIALTEARRAYQGVLQVHACHCDAREEVTCRQFPECRPSYCKLNQGVIDV